jgi:hypothetical protein
VAARDLLSELPLVSWRRQSEPAEVENEVEIGTLDPKRMGDPKRHADQPLSEWTE